MADNKPDFNVAYNSNKNPEEKAIWKTIGVMYDNRGGEGKTEFTLYLDGHVPLKIFKRDDDFQPKDHGSTGGNRPYNDKPQYNKPRGNWDNR